MSDFGTLTNLGVSSVPAGFASTGTYRYDGTCTVAKDGVLYPMRYQGDPIPPLSRVLCWEEGEGAWWCLGPVGEGPSRVVLHDDFNGVSDGATFFGDTAWERQGSSTHIAAVLAQAPYHGAVQCRSGAVDNEVAGIRKSDSAYSLERPWWYSARWRAGGTETRRYAHGLFDSTNTDGAQFRYDSVVGTDWFVRLFAAGVSTDFTLPASYAVVTGEWMVFDMVLVGDEFLAVWFNGEGPYWTTTGVPASTGQAGLRSFLTNLTAAARAYALDWQHTEVFPDATRPDLIGEHLDEMSMELVAA